MNTFKQNTYRRLIRLLKNIRHQVVHLKGLIICSKYRTNMLTEKLKIIWIFSTHDFIPKRVMARLWLFNVSHLLRKLTNNPYLHNHSQEYQCEWTIQLNICLLYWYFQQHQHCKNVLHNIRSLAWALIIVGPQATPQRAHALRLVQKINNIQKGHK
jgi:hypothetical protein